MKSNACGASQPNRDGPSRMPMTISPTAADCPQRRAIVPPTRPASTMTVSCKSVNRSKSSLLCAPATAALGGVISSGHPAVDRYDLARDIARLRGGEKPHEVRHLLGGPGALHGHELADPGRIELGLAHGGRDDTRSNRVDRDAAARHFETQRLGGGVQSTLGGRIIHLSAVADERCDRGDIDHPAPAR